MTVIKREWEPESHSWSPLRRAQWLVRDQLDQWLSSHPHRWTQERKKGPREKGICQVKFPEAPTPLKKITPRGSLDCIFQPPRLPSHRALLLPHDSVNQLISFRSGQLTWWLWTYSQFCQNSSVHFLSYIQISCLFGECKVPYSVNRLFFLLILTTENQKLAMDAKETTLKYEQILRMYEIILKIGLIIIIKRESTSVVTVLSGLTISLQFRSLIILVA